MDIKLGTLTIVPAITNLSLLAPLVAKALIALPDADTVGAVQIDPALSDTAAFCAHYKVELTQGANCVIVEAKRAERTWFAACVILGSTRADINGLARRTLDARRVSFAPMEAAVAATGMEYGAITPVGLPAEWPILVDKAVADSDYLIIGSGIRGSKLAVPGKLLASLPNAQVVENLGR
jgi:prolyl-tRNA editing enzyme YbaK/EbsC (Cys-tRNA(Pro) deacylase)